MNEHILLELKLFQYLLLKKDGIPFFTLYKKKYYIRVFFIFILSIVINFLALDYIFIGSVFIFIEIIGVGYYLYLIYKVKLINDEYLIDITNRFYLNSLFSKEEVIFIKNVLNDYDEFKNHLSFINDNDYIKTIIHNIINVKG